MSPIRKAKLWLATLFLFGCLTSNSIAVELVYLNTPAGTNLLLKADLNKQFFSLMPYVVTEEHETFCGPASIASTLNSLAPKNRPVNCCQFRSTTKESFSIVNHCSNMG